MRSSYLRLSFFLLLWPFALSAWAANQYVNSLSDFYIHTANHVDNVQKLADKVFDIIQSDPGKYAPAFGIPPGTPLGHKLKVQLKRYIQLHDEAKLNTDRSFLEKYGRSRPILEDLYTQYGGPASPEIVNMVNAVDAKVGQDYFLSMGIPKNHWKRNFFETVEKFADNIERGSNKVTSEEMGRIAYVESGSLKFKAQKAAKEDAPKTIVNALRTRAQLAFELEVRYPLEATTFEEAKLRYLAIAKHFTNLGIFPHRLDELGIFRLIRAYEEKFGKILDPQNPQLVSLLKQFFFQNTEGNKILLSTYSITPELPDCIIKYRELLR